MATAAANLVFEWLSKERVMVMYQGTHETGDAELEPYFELLQSLEGTGKLAIFVYTEGGRPTRDQQQRLIHTCKAGWPIAIVSPSTAVRFVFSVFALALPDIRLFGPDHVSEACAHLGCDADATAAVCAAIDRAKLALEAAARIAGVAKLRGQKSSPLAPPQPSTGRVPTQPKVPQSGNLSPARRGTNT